MNQDRDWHREPIEEQLQELMNISLAEMESECSENNNYGYGYDDELPECVIQIINLSSGDSKFINYEEAIIDGFIPIGTPVAPEFVTVVGENEFRVIIHRVQ